MTVAVTKAAEIRADACRKQLARKWERSGGESGPKPARSRIAAYCLNSSKAKVHRNLIAWDPIPPKQPRKKGKKAI